MNMLSLLTNSICYPALMMSCATYDEQFMRRHPDFIANMKNFQRGRDIQILRSCNETAGRFDPIFTG